MTLGVDVDGRGQRTHGRLHGYFRIFHCDISRETMCDVVSKHLLELTVCQSGRQRKGVIEQYSLTPTYSRHIEYLAENS